MLQQKKAQQQRQRQHMLGGGGAQRNRYAVHGMAGAAYLARARCRRAAGLGRARANRGYPGSRILTAGGPACAKPRRVRTAGAGQGGGVQVWRAGGPGGKAQMQTGEHSETTVMRTEGLPNKQAQGRSKWKPRHWACGFAKAVGW